MKISDKTKIHPDMEFILKKVANSEDITNYEVLTDTYQNGEKDGFLSNMFMKEILNKDNNKITHVLIKMASGFTIGFGNETIYKNEVHFYSKVFPELVMFQLQKGIKTPFEPVPRYLEGSDDLKVMFIAMENLRPAGYVLYDKKKYLDNKHLEYILKSYGKFHALSFTFKQENPEKYEKLTERLTSVFEKWSDITSFWKHTEKAYLCALDHFDPVAEADILVKLRRAQDVQKSLKEIQKYKGKYKCLVHGDCWSNNMLFKYKESNEIEDLKLVDFQILGTSTPIHDLSYFFYSGASKEDMDKLDYYLDIYYESFSKFARELGREPEKMFPLNILKKEWKHYGLIGIFLGLQLWGAKLADKNEIVDIFSQQGLSEEEYWELWVGKTTEIRKGLDYRERARNICLHAVEYGIL